MSCGVGFSCAWVSFISMLDTSERQFRIAIATMIHRIVFIDFPFGLCESCYPTIAERVARTRFIRSPVSMATARIAAAPSRARRLLPPCAFLASLAFPVLSMAMRDSHIVTEQERADTWVRPYGIQINVPKIHAPPCAIVSLKTSHPMRETAASPLLRRRRRGRRRLHDRAFSGSARGWILFSNHGLLLIIPWKLFAQETLPSRLRRQAPTCRQHPLRECARRLQAILPPRQEMSCIRATRPLRRPAVKVAFAPQVQYKIAIRVAVESGIPLRRIGILPRDADEAQITMRYVLIQEIDRQQTETDRHEG